MPRMTPLRAIRAKCIDCSGGSKPEVKHCPITDCPLWPYRMGKNPARAGKGPKHGPPRPPSKNATQAVVSGARTDV
jgi:hypothetical protein